jgi:hypothetical protein
MKKVFILFGLIALMSQLALSQDDPRGAVKVFDAKGNRIGDRYQLKNIDSVVFKYTEMKCVLDDHFDTDPLANGWKYTANSNPEASISQKNSAIWVKDSIYGTVNKQATGIEIEKEFSETIADFEFSAKAIINATAFKNTSPVVTFGLVNEMGITIFKVQITRDSCLFYSGNTLQYQTALTNTQETSISIKGYTRTTTWGNFIYFSLNGTFLKDAVINEIPKAKKAFISIKSFENPNTNKAIVDFIKVCRPE